MKKVIVLLVALVWCHAASSQKVTFRLHGAATYPVIPNVQEETMFDFYMPPTEGQDEYSYQEKGIIHTNFIQKAGGKFGGTVAISVSPKFALETGLQANMVRYRISKHVIFPDQEEANSGNSTPQERQIARDSDGNPLVDAEGNYIYTRPGSSSGTKWKDGNEELGNNPQGYHPDPKTGNATLIYLDIPLAARYALHKFIDLKVGMTSSLLAYSQQHKSFPNNDIRFMHPDQEASIEWTSSDDYARYGKDKSGSGLNKTLLALTTGITLKATQHIEVNLDYARYITPVYKKQIEGHPHKYNLFSTGLSYAF